MTFYASADKNARDTLHQRRRKLYDAKWRAAKKAFLHLRPWCAFCEAKGQFVSAKVVDHVRPHRGDSALFWDVGNWQPLCATCHNSTKQKIERRKHKFSVDGDNLYGDKRWKKTRREITVAKPEISPIQSFDWEG